VTEAPYERYKDALRRGHVALARGRNDAAMAAYAEAAEIAPDRALPFVGIGNACLGLQRPADALAAFARALERAPGDEGALVGRADALVDLGRRVEAAQALDRLALLFEDSNRPADACDAARRALELAESRDRRQHLERLLERLTAASPDPATEQAITAASALLEAAPSPLGAEEVASAVAEVGETPMPVAAIEGPGEPEAAALPADPIILVAEGESLLEAGELEASRRHLLEAARAFAADGRLDAAIDACTTGLAAAPDDPDLHLELVALYLRQGWRPAASEKLLLLARLARMANDEATLERIAAYAQGPLADDPALVDLRIR
jgi:tetratricopeptide (TPR) repeat protein